MPSSYFRPNYINRPLIGFFFPMNHRTSGSQITKKRLSTSVAGKLPEQWIMPESPHGNGLKNVQARTSSTQSLHHVVCKQYNTLANGNAPAGPAAVPAY